MTSIVEGELTSVALCWRIERSDGTGLGLTSHDQALIIDQASYLPSPGIVPAAVTRSLGLDPQSGEVAGALTSEAIEEHDLAIGRWDGAAVRLFLADWRDTGAVSIDLVAGELGEVSIDGSGFSAELRGAAALLDNAVCPSTSPQCRAQFGDRACRVDLAGRTKRARIIDHDNGVLMLDQTIDVRYLLGRLRYLSGDNCGRATVIIAVDGATVTVRDLPRGDVPPDSLVELREGCDKRFETCVSRFANASNFRGEPHLPGADLLTRYPGA